MRPRMESVDKACPGPRGLALLVLGLAACALSTEGLPGEGAAAPVNESPGDGDPPGSDGPSEDPDDTDEASAPGGAGGAAGVGGTAGAGGSGPGGAVGAAGTGDGATAGADGGGGVAGAAGAIGGAAGGAAGASGGAAGGAAGASGGVAGGTGGGAAGAGGGAAGGTDGGAAGAGGGGAGGAAGAGGLGGNLATGGAAGKPMITGYDFESDAEGWQYLKNQGTAIQQTTERASHGMGSLEAIIDTRGGGNAPRDRYIGLPTTLAPPLVPAQTVTLRVWLPPDVSLSGFQPFVVTTEGDWEGTWIPAGALKRGDWHRVSVKVPERFAGKTLEWMGIQFVTPTNGWRGSVFIDHVEF